MTSPDVRRVIPDPGFAGDDGTASPQVREALLAWERDPTQYGEALAALASTRLLVPVVAVLGEVEHDADGLAHDKSSDMATVLLQGADGRLALLAFTGADALAAWNPDGRPVPVRTELAARAAVQDGAAALVVDVAGPVRFVVDGDDLRRLAEGWTLARVREQPVWIRPEPGSSASL